MKKIIALLLFGILLFGCTLPSAPGTGTGGVQGGAPASSTPHTATGGTSTGQEPANVTPAEPQAPAPEPPPQTADRQALIRWFVMNKLMDGDGGIKESYNSTSYSSQSVWMMMDYALDTWNETLFQKEYSLLSEKFLDANYNLAYGALDAQKEPEKKNNLYYSETGDNLRIAKALFTAHERWGGTDYSNVATRMANSMVANSVFAEVLVKESYWSSGGISPATRMRTADAEWSVMETFKLNDRNWIAVTTTTRSHTLGCTESGFFWPEFNVANPACDYGSGNADAKTVDSLQSAISFADMGALEPAIMTFTKISNEYNQRHIISNAYTIPLNAVGNGEEDPGTYATMGLLAVKLNRCDFAASMRDRMLEYFVSDTASPLYGSISREGDAYAYDNLEALLFLEAYSEACG